MVAAIPFFVGAGLAAGPVLAEVKSVWLRRVLGWMVLAVALVGADQCLIPAGPVLRMIGICCVLLGCMKGLVYAEWAGPQRLGVVRYLMFSLLWFGMDPGSFLSCRKALSWRGDVGLGVLLMLAGTAGAWLVWRMDWHNLLAMFVPTSIGFHFGALRVLKGGLRAAGFPVRTLFPNLLEARGIGDFWSRRWNVGYSQMMQRVVGRPVENIAGKSAGLMAVFVTSGLLHELAIALPVRSGYGGPLLYFTFHGFLTLLERKRGRPFGRIPALLAVMLPLGLLFPPAFRDEVIARCLAVFGG